MLVRKESETLQHLLEKLNNRCYIGWLFCREGSSRFKRCCPGKRFNDEVIEKEKMEEREVKKRHDFHQGGKTNFHTS